MRVKMTQPAAAANRRRKMTRMVTPAAFMMG